MNAFRTKSTHPKVKLHYHNFLLSKKKNQNFGGEELPWLQGLLKKI